MYIISPFLSLKLATFFGLFPKGKFSIYSSKTYCIKHCLSVLTIQHWQKKTLHF